MSAPSSPVVHIQAAIIGAPQDLPAVAAEGDAEHAELEVTCNMARLTQGGIQKVFSSILISTHKLNNIETINDSQESGSFQPQTHLLVHV